MEETVRKQGERELKQRERRVNMDKSKMAACSPKGAGTQTLNNSERFPALVSGKFTRRQDGQRDSEKEKEKETKDKI